MDFEGPILRQKIRLITFTSSYLYWERSALIPEGTRSLPGGDPLRPFQSPAGALRVPLKWDDPPYMDHPLLRLPEVHQ